MAAIWKASCGEASFSLTGAVHAELISQAAFSRGLAVHFYDKRFYVLSTETREVGFFRRMSSLTPIVARHATNHKDLTKARLQGAGIRVAKGEAFQSDQREAAWTFAQSLEGPCVVKPASGSGGRGVSTEISKPDQFSVAWHAACKETDGRLLVEEFVRGLDYRFFVVGDRVEAVLCRTPAHVVGNGQDSIRCLLEQKQQARAGRPYLSIKPISVSQSILYNLENMGLSLDSVLPDQKEVQLHSVANVSSGGESLDVDLAQIHPGFLEVAVAARKQFFDPVHCGIDVLAEDLSRSPDEQQWAICEVNSNPDIALHHFPSSGAARDVAGALVEHLFPETGELADVARHAGRHLLLACDVALLEDHARAVWRQAHQHALSGRVEAGKDGLHIWVRGHEPAINCFKTALLSDARELTEVAAVPASEVGDADGSFEDPVSSGPVAREAGKKKSRLIVQKAPKKDSGKRRTVRLRVIGGVTGVGYRRWLEKQARKLGVSGQARNAGDDELRAILSGDEAAVGRLLLKCQRGPKKANVKKIITRSSKKVPDEGFQILP